MCHMDSTLPIVLFIFNKFKVRSHLFHATSFLGQIT